MKILGKGLIAMAEEQNKENNVIDFDPSEIAKSRLLLTQIKTLLSVKAKDFAEQYVNNTKDSPQYLIDENGAIEMFEKSLGKCLTADEWDNDDLIAISAHTFLLVVIDHIADYYDEPETEQE